MAKKAPLFNTPALMHTATELQFPVGLAPEYYICLDRQNRPLLDKKNKVLVEQSVDKLRKALQSRLEIFPIFDSDSLNLRQTNISMYHFDTQTGRVSYAYGLPGNRIIGIRVLNQTLMFQQPIVIPDSAFDIITPDYYNRGYGNMTEEQRIAYQNYRNSYRKNRLNWKTLVSTVRKAAEHIIPSMFESGQLRIVQINEIRYG